MDTLESRIGASLGKFFSWDAESHPTNNVLLATKDGDVPLFALCMALMAKTFAERDVKGYLVREENGEAWLYYAESEDAVSEHDALWSLCTDMNMDVAIYPSDLVQLEEALLGLDGDVSDDELSLRVNLVADLLHRTNGKRKRDEEVSRSIPFPVPRADAELILKWVASKVPDLKERYEKNKNAKLECIRRLRDLADLIEEHL